MKYSVFYSNEPKEYKAIAEIYSNIPHDSVNTVLLFISENYDLKMISAGIKKVFEGMQIFACTSKTLIYNNSFKSYGIVAIGFYKEDVNSEIIYIRDINDFSNNKAELFSLNFKTKNSDFFKYPSSYIGIIFYNNLLNNEISLQLSQFFNPINIMGVIPSSSNLTPLFFNGECFSEKSAVLLILKCKTQIIPYNLANVLPTEQPLVVTFCNESERVVYELNSEKAANVISKLIGCNITDIDENKLNNNPLLIRYKNKIAPIVIKRINEIDLSIEFFIKVTLGTVLRLGINDDICGSTQKHLIELEKTLGNFKFNLIFDSTYRYLNAKQNNILKSYSESFNNFNCYGCTTQTEYLQGINHNSTLSGVAFLE